MSSATLQEFYIKELKYLYDAESQLLKALPLMADAASSVDLKRGFKAHLEQTKSHVARLEQIFESLDETPKGKKKCVGMEGLVKEGGEIMMSDLQADLMDSALIGAAQRVEHYEIAAYMTVRNFAQLLGESRHATLLTQTMEEEMETDEKLTELAKDINPMTLDDSSHKRAKNGRAATHRMDRGLSFYQKTN